MSVQLANFTNFHRGVHTDESLADQGFIREAQAIDIYGTGAGTFSGAPHRPGVIMPSQRLSAESVGAVSAGTHIQDLIEWITPFSSRTYGLAATSAAHLYVTESTPATDSQQTWYLVSSLSSATGGGGLMPFGSNLYYGQNTVLGKTDTTATNNNFKTFTESSVTPRPMKIFGGKLMVGNGRYIASLDSDESTFTGAALTLPIGFVVRSMDVWNGNLSIAADYTPTGATNSTASYLFLWNGTDPTFTQELQLPFTSAPLIFAHDNLLWIFGSDGALNGLVFVYNGAQLEKAFFLPNVVFHGNGSVGRFQSNIIVGTNGRTTSDEGGVWTIGRGGSEKPYAPSLSHIPSGVTAVSAVNCGAIYAESNNILTSWTDNTAYGMDRSANAFFPQGNSVLQTLPFHFGSPQFLKTFISIKPDLESAGTTTGSTFQILYRTDLATSFTALKTINASDTNLSPLIPLRKVKGRRIEFQFKWVTTSNAPLRLRSFSVLYSPQGKSR